MRQRAPPNSKPAFNNRGPKAQSTSMSDPKDDPRQALLSQESSPTTANASTAPAPHSQPPTTATTPGEEEMDNLSQKSQWIVLALASGCCAAFNGVFAKLTTTELTTTFATWIANLIGLSQIEGGVEVVVRILFFVLNLIFNGIMWTLFTKALARGTSTTQVSILNTSANFMITALLGALIFSEHLPPLWFVGAALLVAGNVIIGRREEGDGGKSGGEVGGGVGAGGVGSEQEDLLLGEVDEEGERRRKSREEDDRDVLLLGSEDDEDEARNDLQLM